MSTGAEMVTRILRRLDELSTSSPVHWTRAEILDHVNEALRELNLIAWEFQNTFTKTADTNTNVYDHPSGVLAAIDIREDGGRYLFRQSLGDLDKEIKWEDVNAKRLHISSWSPLGLNKFVISPKPLGNKTLYIEALTEPTTVTDSSASDIPVRDEFEDAIENFCVERAMFKEGGPELAQAHTMYEAFLEDGQELSGKNINRMHPQFSQGKVADDTLRDSDKKGRKK
jgi:hypothetical protein